ncbi:hypothetical protein DV515_00017115 [Chloebia gouldiae]|uniref:Uncharacterized protein n=1 Tax=Chloebia gouldiae TaxID=44316 RepID=A0A3L8R9D3_CHLGU|nr:hypothetical protein DV515_00017108 [Chloebia gouldiae]RLV76312.1 hypothetical protein DV515_00017115 [Chloebia gouldiae]
MVPVAQQALSPSRAGATAEPALSLTCHQPLHINGSFQLDALQLVLQNQLVRGLDVLGQGWLRHQVVLRGHRDSLMASARTSSPHGLFPTPDPTPSVRAQLRGHNSHPELCERRGGGGGDGGLELHRLEERPHHAALLSLLQLREPPQHNVVPCGEPGVSAPGGTAGTAWGRQEQLQGPSTEVLGNVGKPPASPRGTAPSGHVWARWGRGAFQSLQACRHFLCAGGGWVRVVCSAPSNCSAQEGPRRHLGQGAAVPAPHPGDNPNILELTGRR